MPTAIIVNGANGKMGVAACEMLTANPEFNLVGRLCRSDDLSAAIKRTQASIVVDLTRADCVYTNTLNIINAGAHPIIGTSGLTLDQRNDLIDRCTSLKLGGLIIPNFSISMVLMMRFAEEAARILPDVEIIEAHHQQKLDSPSGTAINTAEKIAAARATAKKSNHETQILACARGAEYQGIHIHSIRLPGILAQQQVIFGSSGETLTLTHNTLDRNAFMPGLLLACRKVTALNTLYNGLEHIL